MSKPVRIGLVGCGRLATFGYLPALTQVGAAQLIAVVDRDAIRRQRLAGLASSSSNTVVAFATVEAMLAGADLDAVVIATPVARHVADAVAADAAGVAVLLEKPPALNADDAAEIPPSVWIGFNRRYDPAAQRLRAALPSAGDLDVQLRIEYRRRSWNAYVADDDAWLDLGPHLVDWARWLSDAEVLEVNARELSREVAVVDLVLERGRARLLAATNRMHRESIEVRGSDGKVLARHRAGGARAAVLGRVARGPHPLVTTLRRQLEELCALVRGEAADTLATARDGCSVMSVIDAGRASAASGGRVEVAPVAVEPVEARGAVV